MHCASRSGQEAVVDLLLSRGASVMARTRSGLTALHMAVQGDNVQCVRLLILNGANIDAQTAVKTVVHFVFQLTDHRLSYERIFICYEHIL